MIQRELLQMFQFKNLRLIFCIGVPGSGMESQVEKVCNEFKYNKIDIQELIQKEIRFFTQYLKLQYLLHYFIHYFQSKLILSYLIIEYLVIIFGI